MEVWENWQIGKLPNRQIDKLVKFANYQIFTIFAL